MKLKKWIGLLMAMVILTVSLTGCLGHVFTKAMTIEGEDISSGLYLLMQMVAVGEAMTETGDETGDVETVLAGTIEDEETGESTKVTDWVKNRTVELLSRMVAVEKLCAEHDITLSEENIEAVEADLSSWETNGWQQYYADNGIGAESMRRYLENMYLDNQLYEFYYGEGGEKAPTREEIAAHYAESNAHVELTLVTTMTVEDNAEQMKTVRQSIDDIVSSLQSGEDFGDVITEQVWPLVEAIEEMTQANEQEAAEGEETDGEETEGENTEDELDELDEAVTDEIEEELETEEEQTGEEETEPEETEEEPKDPADEIIDYYISYEVTEDGMFSEEFINEVKAQKVGDAGSYDMSGAYMIYRIQETFTTDEQYEQVRDSVVQELKSDEYDDFIAEVAASYTVSWVPLAAWYLSPKKIKN